MLQNIYVELKSDSHIDETVLNEWLQTEKVLTMMLYRYEDK